RAVLRGPLPRLKRVPDLRSPLPLSPPVLLLRKTTSPVAHSPRAAGLMHPHPTGVAVRGSGSLPRWSRSAVSISARIGRGIRIGASGWGLRRGGGGGVRGEPGPRRPARGPAPRPRPRGRPPGSGGGAPGRGDAPLLEPPGELCGGGDVDDPAKPAPVRGGAHRAVLAGGVGRRRCPLLGSQVRRGPAGEERYRTTLHRRSRLLRSCTRHGPILVPADS